MSKFKLHQAIAHLYISGLIILKVIPIIPLNFAILAAPILCDLRKIRINSLFFLFLIAPLFIYSADTNLSSLGMYFAIIFLTFGPNKNFSLKLNYSFLLAFFIIVYQFYISYTRGDVRPSLFGLEQNFSALAIFILYSIIFSAKRFGFLLLGLITLSRSFFFAVIIREILAKVPKFLISKNFYYLIIFMMIFAFIGAHFIILSSNDQAGYTQSIDRLFTINDSSLYKRLLMNVLFITEASDYYFKGISVDQYITMGENFGVVAHNSFLQTVILYGWVPTLIYYIILVVAFSKHVMYRICFISLFSFSLVLNSVFNPINVILVYTLIYYKLNCCNKQRHFNLLKSAGLAKTSSQ